MPENVVLKALSVAGTGSVENYLPDPLAAEVIDYVRELNVVRKLINVFKMNSRRWTKPKKNGALSAYYVPDGVTAPLSAYSTSQVTWIAKKLMAFTMVDEEAIEDSQPDVVNQVLMDFAEAIAEAEEYALVQGDTTHLATAPTPSAATDANWYVYDPRLIFDGLFTVAASGDASTGINAGGAEIDLDYVNQMIYNLGKYGRNRNRLIGLTSSDQAAKMRQDSNFKDASVTGQALASFITGLGSAGEGRGIVAVIYNVPFYEVPLAPAGQVMMFDRDAAEMGDRRRIKVKSTEVIEADQRKYVTSERIAFNYNYKEALVLCQNLDTTVGPASSSSG